MNFNIYLSNYNYELLMKSMVRPLIHPKLKIRPFPTLFQLDFFFLHAENLQKKKDFQCAFCQYLSILVLNYLIWVVPCLARSMLKVQELWTWPRKWTRATKLSLFKFCQSSNVSLINYKLISNYYSIHKWYVCNIFTTNPKWQVVTHGYCSDKKVIVV